MPKKTHAHLSLLFITDVDIISENKVCQQTEEKEEEVFACPHCETEFSTEKKLAVHLGELVEAKTSL